MKRVLLLAAVLLAMPCAASAQDWAKTKLDKSPRHQEWVKLTSGNREVNAFLVFPEVKDKATSVIVIHEIFGLSDWVRSVADQLAEAGYIAIAPDLLSGDGANKKGTADFPGRNEVMQAVRDIPADRATADLNATYEYLAKLPAANGKIVVSGFCWGGGKSFDYATKNKNVKASFVFYGSPPKESEMKAIACPVYGFYAQNDARINATIPDATTQMKAAGKTYDPVTYAGAGHGFMRDAEDPDPRSAAERVPNIKAREESWARWKKILQEL